MVSGIGLAVLLAAYGIHYAYQQLTKPGLASAASLAVTCDEANLASCLEKEPAGVTPDVSSWATNASPTAQQYADEYHDPGSQGSKSAVGNLQKAGLQAMAHEAWDFGTGDEYYDVVVMRFATSQGAQATALAFQGTSLAPEEGTGQHATVQGLPGEVYPGTDGSGADASSGVDVRYAQAVGNLAMVVHLGDASFDQGRFASWAGGEYLSLKTAKIPAAPAETIDTATTSCTPLTSCLVAAPAGSAPWQTSWGGETTPSPRQFVQQLYAGSFAQTVADKLTNQGLTGIAHRTWALNGGSGDEADLLLLQFKTTQGAESRADEEISNLGGGTKFAVSGPGGGQGVVTTSADSQGFYNTQLDGYVGNVEVELFTFAPQAAVSRNEATDWAQAEFEKLAAATAKGTAPQPAISVPSTVPSPTSGSSSCGVPLSCLMPTPSGGAAYTGDSFDTTPTVSITQYVDEKYATSADRGYEQGVLMNAGVKDIVHREWIGADGNQADVDVLVFANATDAQAEAMDYQGVLLGGDRRFSIPGYPDAIGVVKPGMDSDGFVDAELVAYTAKFEVHMDYYSPAGFSAADAIAWFDAQMALLPAS